MTTFRASDDYGRELVEDVERSAYKWPWCAGPGQTGYYPTKRPGKPPTDGSTGCRFPYCVYYVGTTSILAHAMQVPMMLCTHAHDDTNETVSRDSWAHRKIIFGRLRCKAALRSIAG